MVSYPDETLDCEIVYRLHHKPYFRKAKIFDLVYLPTITVWTANPHIGDTFQQGQCRSAQHWQELGQQPKQAHRAQG